MVCLFKKSDLLSFSNYKNGILWIIRHSHIAQAAQDDKIDFTGIENTMC